MAPQGGADLVCQQPASGLGAERGGRHGGLSGLRRHPADAQKRLRHARPGERGSGGGGDPPRPGEGQNHIAFPTGFSLALRLLASLPSGIQRLLLRRMVRS